MEAMRESWTDDRLDDMSNRMDRGFDRVHADIRAEASSVRGEIRSQGAELREEIRAQGAELREEIKAQGVELRGEIGELRGEIGALQRTLLQVGGGLIGTVLVSAAGIIATQL
ncbi:MAG TPA: hypothetical protein VFX85_10190 [Solirubrobacterales bacterium]|nr:hypothetical protein [Solirubrobacterales bacterium]